MISFLTFITSTFALQTQTFYDISCVTTKCALALTQCKSEVPLSTLPRNSYCTSIIHCVQAMEQSQPGSNPDICAQGLSWNDATVAEKSLLDCVHNMGCSKVSNPSLAITTPAPSNLNIQVTSVVTPMPSKLDTPFIPMPSFFQLAKVNANKFALAQKEAEREEKEAETAWEKSKVQTESLLSKVHGQMKSLTEDLAKSTAEEKKDLALLESSREKEDSDLKATEEKLEVLAHTPITPPPLSSFFQGGKDFLEPLRKAAKQARTFAESVRKQEEEFQKMNKRANEDLLQNPDVSSFLESKQTKTLSEKNLIDLENESNEKADRSLAMAQKSLSKLNEDLAHQKHQLILDEAKAKKEHEALIKSHGLSLGEDFGIISPISFLQTDSESDFSNVDPLSPQALSAWRENFVEQLQKARDVAGVKTPLHSSLMQLDLTPHSSFLENDKLRQDERNVQRLQEVYNDQMAKLKQDNAQLMAEAKEEMEKARDMKSKLDASTRESLLQSNNIVKYDPVKEDEKIRELERKWKRDVAKISSGNQLNEESSSINAMIQQQKSKEVEAQADLDRMRAKLNKDIALMHKDVSLINMGSNARSSFLSNNHEAATSFIEAGENSHSTYDKPQEDSLTHARLLLKQLDDVVNSKKNSKSASSVSSVTIPLKSIEPESTPVSFIQLDSSKSVSIDDALEKAEVGLKKLQKQLQDQTEKLRQMAKSSTSTFTPDE